MKLGRKWIFDEQTLTYPAVTYQLHVWRRQSLLGTVAAARIQARRTRLVRAQLWAMRLVVYGGLAWGTVGLAWWLWPTENPAQYFLIPPNLVQETVTMQPPAPTAAEYAAKCPPNWLAVTGGPWRNADTSFFNGACCLPDDLGKFRRVIDDVWEYTPREPAIGSMCPKVQFYRAAAQGVSMQHVSCSSEGFRMHTDGNTSNTTACIQSESATSYTFAR